MRFYMRGCMSRGDSCGFTCGAACCRQNGRQILTDFPSIFSRKYMLKTGPVHVGGKFSRKYMLKTGPVHVGGKFSGKDMLKTGPVHVGGTFSRKDMLKTGSVHVGGKFLHAKQVAFCMLNRKSMVGRFWEVALFFF